MGLKIDKTQVYTPLVFSYIDISVYILYDTNGLWLWYHTSKPDKKPL